MDATVPVSLCLCYGMFLCLCLPLVKELDFRCSFRHVERVSEDERRVRGEVMMAVNDWVGSCWYRRVELSIQRRRVNGPYPAAVCGSEDRVNAV